VAVGLGADAPKVPANVERFVRQLVVTYKAVMLYPPASTIPRDNATDTIRLLSDIFRERAELRFIIQKNGMFFGDVPVFPGQSAFTNFSQELYHRGLAEVRFHTGIDARDIVSFLGVMKSTPQEVAAAGGFEARLWELGVDTVTVAEAQLSLVDAPTLGETPDEPAQRLSTPEIDELLAAAYGGRPRDQRVLTRFMGDSAAVKDYLTETFSGRGDRNAAMIAVGESFSELAQVASTQDVEERLQLFRSLAESLMDLDPDMRRDLLVEHVLPEAKTSDSLASVVRQMDIDAVCRMLVDGLDADQVSREGLARAIRNLAQISMSSREDVVNAAGAAMRGAGFSEGVVGSVIETAAPSRLEVRDASAKSAGEEQPVEAIFKLMDLAPTPVKTFVDGNPGVVKLQEEARRGITDGDIIGALVSLVALDPREGPFATTMSMLEDSLELLIERGDLDVAADASETLLAAIDNPELSPEQRNRLRKSLERFGETRNVRSIVQALRLYPVGSSENHAARRLLDVLGADVISPLLEQLANEPDMASRKAMVDLLSELASEHIQELGRHISDPRWYVSRNVVSILGATHSSAALPYLERTIRHAEPRVRRETIRALSGIQDRLANEMLMAALQDDDPQNVQLSARYLGATGERRAVAALELVARGEGRGNRDTGPRVEAIEALGRLGAREAMPTLEALSGKRAVFRQAQARELRAAADSAIARIAAGKGGA
jgi:hypothetical protein